ncbi:AidA/PixA family protein [Photorhabdus antumapuensis]|uniref:AidA/PixA family protein n=1 Tax=Photorhabdus antumapuensis TaxID=2862867 RepID=UPI001CEC037D|nr:AidA/PixA family protein [Photorhabdus antumapuensis]MCA6222600.1 inclusion body family protein [Photorhabdus antumapuensis]
MNNTVDILICVDTRSIIEKYPSLSQNPENPTLINDELFYYIVSIDNLYIPGNNATGKMEIKAYVGDNIRWRSVSLTQQFEYTTILYEMTGTVINETITIPKLYQSEINSGYISNNSDRLDIEHELIKRYYFQSIAIRSGGGKCSWIIAIYQQKELKGYVQHTPLEIGIRIFPM